MKKKILQIISIIILVLGIVGINTIFAACASDKAMKCNAAVSAVGLLFLTSVIIRLIDVITKENTRHYKIVTLLLSVNTILIPSVVIGGCKILDMACHTRAYPFIYLISIVTILIDIIQFFTIKKK